VEEITEELMEKLQDMVDHIVQDSLKNLQDTQIKNLRRHRNNLMNSERTSTNTKMKQKTLFKKRDM
jgi:hypothetical protein